MTALLDMINNNAPLILTVSSGAHEAGAPENQKDFGCKGSDNNCNIQVLSQ